MAAAESSTPAQPQETTSFALAPSQPGAVEDAASGGIALAHLLEMVRKTCEMVRYVDSGRDAATLVRRARGLEQLVRTALKDCTVLEEEQFELRQEAAEAHVRTQRRAGELLSELQKHRGGRPPKTITTVEGVPEAPPPTLRELGIDSHESHRWQRIAGVPEDVFERYIATCRSRRTEITTANVLALRWFLSHVRPFWPHMLLFLLGGLIWEVCSAAVPVITGRAFDAVLGGRRDAAALGSAAVLLVAVLLFRGVVAGIGGKFVQETMGTGFVRDLRDELYLDLLRKGQSFFDRRPVGDLMARITNDADVVYNVFQPGLEFLLLIGLYGTIVPLAFIAGLGPQLLLTPLLFIAAFALAIRLYNRRLGPASSASRAAFGAMNEHVTETMSGVEHVRMSRQGEREAARFVERARAYRDASVRASRVKSFYLAPLLLVVALAAGLLHGLVLETRGELSIGGLVAYLGLLASLQQPVEAFGNGLFFMRLGQSSVERILELLRDDVPADQAAARGQAMRGEVVFDGVTFGYDGAPVLHDVSLQVEPGETIALVGQTGSGKSTLLRLVNRTYAPDRGRILVDGVDLREWDLRSLRSQIAVIEQDVVLFSRTIAENIAFGVGAEADQDRIEQAARDARAHEFITGFEDGYRTVLGERGVTLSGGQRQRIAIARALLTDPRILIMDDSTSAVDSATEVEIQNAIAMVAAGRTTFLITHRLSAIRRASRSVVLEAGRVLDAGSHDELLVRCELYRRIFAAYR